MLFLLGDTNLDPLKESLVLAGEDDKEVLLISDAVHLGRAAGLAELKALGLETVYAEKKAVQDRGLTLPGGCKVLDMAEVLELMFDHQKIVNA